MSFSSPIFIPRLIFFFYFFSIPAFSITQNHFINGFHLDLIHRHSLFETQSLSLSERVQELFEHDINRVQILSERSGFRSSYPNHVHGRTEDSEKMVSIRSKKTSAAIPISSAAYRKIGEYFVPLKIGTPSRKFLLIVDTGSDLTWINCRYRCKNCDHRRRINRKRIFQADESSTFKPISCASDLCKKLTFSLVKCPKSADSCQFDYSYEDGANALGFYANETVTVGLINGRKTKLDNVVVGCSSTSSSNFGAADGVLGLGYDPNSFALKAASVFGGKFTYCLVDHLSPKNVSSFLTFGHTKRTRSSHSGSSSKKMKFTKLLLDSMDGLYHVNLVKITVGGRTLKIPSIVFDVNRQGGVILDSGTSLTFLSKPAYTLVTNALRAPLMKLKREKEDPFEFCFSSVGFKEKMVPKLVFHFGGSVRFEPPVKSYVIDVSDGVKCLGFMSTDWPGTSIIGNIMQQNFLWEFDLVRKQVGFLPSTCKH